MLRPPLILKSYLESSELSVGDQIEVGCQGGFVWAEDSFSNTSDSSIVVECGEEGMWLPNLERLPSCTEIPCYKPPQ